MNVNGDSERAVANDIDLKHAMYRTTLAFTILALSVQTADFTKSKTASILELTSWAFLLAAGFSSLFVLRKKSKVKHVLADYLDWRFNWKHKIETANPSEDVKKLYEDYGENEENYNYLKTNVHHNLLSVKIFSVNIHIDKSANFFIFFGILILTLSRAITEVVNIFGYVLM